MTDFLREWAKYYPSSFILIPILCALLCAFFGYLILAAVVSPDILSIQVLETVSKESPQNPETERESPIVILGTSIVMIFLMLSVITCIRLSEFNYSFEGLLVDKYDESAGRGSLFYFKLSKGGREFIKPINFEQYEVAEIGDYVKKEPKTFGLQITPTSDSTDNT